MRIRKRLCYPLFTNEYDSEAVPLLHSVPTERLRYFEILSNLRFQLPHNHESGK